MAIRKRSYNVYIQKHNIIRKGNNLIVQTGIKQGRNTTCQVVFLVRKLENGGYNVRWIDNTLNENCARILTDMEAVATVMMDRLWNKMDKLGIKLPIPVIAGRT